MIKLCATGKSALDDVTPMYLWTYGNYEYEIEVRKSSYYTESEMLKTSYEEALSKFENMVDKVDIPVYSLPCTDYKSIA
jgi:hypothetical protein